MRGIKTADDDVFVMKVNQKGFARYKRDWKDMESSLFVETGIDWSGGCVVAHCICFGARSCFFLKAKEIYAVLFGMLSGTTVGRLFLLFYSISQRNITPSVE